MNGDGDDDDFDQRIVITLTIPGGRGTEIVAAGALLDVLGHLEHDGVRAHRITLEISGQPTTS